MHLKAALEGKLDELLDAEKNDFTPEPSGTSVTGEVTAPDAQS